MGGSGEWKPWEKGPWCRSAMHSVCLNGVYTANKNRFGVLKEPFMEVMLKAITTAGLLLYIYGTYQHLMASSVKHIWCLITLEY